MAGPILNIQVTGDMNIVAIYEVVPDSFIEDYRGYSIWLSAPDQTYYVKDSTGTVVNQGLASVQAARSYIDTLIPPAIHTLSIYTTPITGVIFTVNTANTTSPYSETLNEGNYGVSMPSNASVGGQIYNFTQWSDGASSPTRTVSLMGDISLTAVYMLQPPPPPSKGNLEVHAYLDEVEIVEAFTIANVSATYQTPSTLALDPGSYTVTIRGVFQTAVVVSDQTMRLDFRFVSTPPENPLSYLLPIGIMGSVGYALLSGG